MLIKDEEGRCYSDSIIELSEIDSKTTDQLDILLVNYLIFMLIFY